MEVTQLHMSNFFETIWNIRRKKLFSFHFFWQKSKNLPDNLPKTKFLCQGNKNYNIFIAFSTFIVKHNNSNMFGNAMHNDYNLMTRKFYFNPLSTCWCCEFIFSWKYVYCENCIQQIYLKIFNIYFIIQKREVGLLMSS